MVALSELGRQLEGGAPLADVLAVWRASRPDALALAEARRRARIRASLADDLREEALRNGSLAAAQTQQLLQAAERLEAATAGLQRVTARLGELIDTRRRREAADPPHTPRPREDTVHVSRQPDTPREQITAPHRARLLTRD